MDNKSSQTASNKKALVIERVFNAPRELVWEAWTDPLLLKEWWGPRGVTNPVCEFDARPNGAIHIVMLAGKELGDLAGNEWPMKGVVQKVSEPERLVFTSEAIMNSKPILENLVTVTLGGLGSKTKMKLHVLVTKTTPEAEGPLSGMKQGWTESIDKLEEIFKMGKGGDKI
jgi:uncharacterized protein YndB with AHSA1/START domain